MEYRTDWNRKKKKYNSGIISHNLSSYLAILTVFWKLYISSNFNNKYISSNFEFISCNSLFFSQNYQKKSKLWQKVTVTVYYYYYLFCSWNKLPYIFKLYTYTDKHFFSCRKIGFEQTCNFGVFSEQCAHTCMTEWTQLSIWSMLV